MEMVIMLFFRVFWAIYCKLRVSAFFRSIYFYLYYRGVDYDRFLFFYRYGDFGDILGEVNLLREDVLLRNVILF